MGKNVVIHVDHISKQFKVFFDKSSSLKERVLFKQRRRFEAHQVLSDISFEVRKGEAVGIIGENGCGKSTLLKMLSRIMYPDQGEIWIDGRVSALIELGAGFHPDMSGRENIYTNAAIFGLNRSEIDARLQDIIDFSELGEFIDNPVRTYSSGMYMRLAFSVAINVDADVLLVDEILAVGDAAFQAKCFNRMREIKASGTTIVIVSHSLGQIEQICDRTIWICDGQIREQGLPRDVHPVYMDYMGRRVHGRSETEMLSTLEEITVSSQTENTEKEEVAEEDSKRWGNGDARITAVRLFDKNGEEQSAFATGETLRIQIDYVVKNPLKNPVCGIGVFRNDGLQCYGTNTHIERLENLRLEDAGTITFHVSQNQLLSGEYSLDVAIHAEDGFAYDYYRHAKNFQMYSNIQDAGVVRLEHTWGFESIK